MALVVVGRSALRIPLWTRAALPPSLYGVAICAILRPITAPRPALALLVALALQLVTCAAGLELVPSATILAIAFGVGIQQVK